MGLFLGEGAESRLDAATALYMRYAGYTRQEGSVRKVLHIWKMEVVLKSVRVLLANEPIRKKEPRYGE